jgi:hypothetical protein
VLHDYTAGDPMDKEVIWTNLTQEEIEQKLEDSGIKVSKKVIQQLLQEHGYKKRKAQKVKTMGESKYRDQQFKNISKLRKKFENSDNPIISIDTKKKEFIGNFFREGKLLSQEAEQVYDHDYNSFAEGIVIPHGIYDLKLNQGYINIGTSKDTSEFACDSVEQWWIKEGKKLYSKATEILILCDGGGSNNARHYVFKENLIKLANRLNIKIRIAHYPAYTSKYNPIEHRLFPYITKACQGVIFRNVQIVKQLMQKASTKTGLSVIVNVIDKIYQTGNKVTEEFKKTIKQNSQIIFHETLPQLNYLILPNREVI